jgi:hypothetical protein
MKLTEDQKEALQDLVRSETWPAVLAYCEIVLKNVERSVLECDVNKPRTLLIKRASLDGARQIVSALHQAKANLKIRD